MLLLLAASLHAAPAAPAARAIEVTRADLAFTDAKAPPVAGWTAHRLPDLALLKEAETRGNGSHTVWARFRFERGMLGAGPLALFTNGTRERMVFYLNGTDIHRTFSGDADARFGWNRPFLVPLPEKLIRPGTNEILMRVDTAIGWELAIGPTTIGSDRQMRARYDALAFAQITGVQAVNIVLLILTMAAFLMWLTRRSERDLLWLTMVGAIWFFRNLHFYVQQSPIEPMLFRNLSICSIFILTWALYGFCAEYLKVEGRQRLTRAILAAAVTISLVRTFQLLGPQTDLICYLAYFPVSLFVVYILARACLRTRSVDHVAMLAAVVLCIAVSLHDIGLIAAIQAWRGLGFYLQPYSSLIVFAAFAFSIGRRFVRALGAVEEMNATLEARVAEATGDLARSEASRRALEVENAIEGERQRMMREMHDGIGSSLTTALAVAERQKQPASTIATLRRTLADLKLAVDSLEPIDNDLPTLLASLRHRLGPDLKRAGLLCVWKVEPCPPLPWLDPVNALHILRIVQEAVGNVLAHAGATTIEFACQPVQHDGADGILITIGDNGVGFAADASPKTGRGIDNMRARTRTLGGQFAFRSGEHGSDVTIWLPQKANLATSQTA